MATKAEKEAAKAAKELAKAAAKAKTGKKEDRSGKFLSSEEAKKAQDKISDTMDWAEDMDHEESTNHPKAINRSC